MTSLAFKSRLQMLPSIQGLHPPKDPLYWSFALILHFPSVLPPAGAIVPKVVLSILLLEVSCFSGKNTNSSRLIIEVWGFLFAKVKNPQTRFAAFISLINQKVGGEKSPGTQVWSAVFLSHVGKFRVTTLEWVQKGWDGHSWELLNSACTNVTIHLSSIKTYYTVLFNKSYSSLWTLNHKIKKKNPAYLNMLPLLTQGQWGENGAFI